jgi:hypothetical protein
MYLEFAEKTPCQKIHKEKKGKLNVEKFFNFFSLVVVCLDASPVCWGICNLPPCSTSLTIFSRKEKSVSKRERTEKPVDFTAKEKSDKTLQRGVIYSPPMRT